MAKKQAAQVKADEVKADEVKNVKVRVLCNALGEDSSTYLKGETFDTTPDRAAALGDSVEVVK